MPWFGVHFKCRENPCLQMLPQCWGTGFCRGFPHMCLYMRGGGFKQGFSPSALVGRCREILLQRISPCACASMEVGGLALKVPFCVGRFTWGYPYQGLPERGRVWFSPAHPDLQVWLRIGKWSFPWLARPRAWESATEVIDVFCNKAAVY